MNSPPAAPCGDSIRGVVSDELVHGGIAMFKSQKERKISFPLACSDHELTFNFSHFLLCLCQALVIDGTEVASWLFCSRLSNDGFEDYAGIALLPCLSAGGLLLKIHMSNVLV